MQIAASRVARACCACSLDRTIARMVDERCHDPATVLARAQDRATGSVQDGRVRVAWLKGQCVAESCARACRHVSDRPRGRHRPPTLSPSPLRPMPTEESKSPLSRRAFCASAATAAALAVMPTGSAFASSLSADDLRRTALRAAKTYPIGLELYSVRRELARDLPATLRAVSQMGYQVVEFYAPYLGWTIPYAKDVRTQLDDLGLRCYSTHNPFASLMPGEMMSEGDRDQSGARRTTHHHGVAAAEHVEPGRLEARERPARRRLDTAGAARPARPASTTIASSGIRSRVASA